MRNDEYMYVYIYIYMRARARVCIGKCVTREEWREKSTHACTKISIILFYEFTRSDEC